MTAVANKLRFRRRPRGRTGGTFAALQSRPYRQFCIGQAVSLPGTWMQTVGQGWLILELTDSGTALGLLTAAQFVPVLLLAPVGGLLADRYSKRMILMATQLVMGLTALVLGLLTVTHVVNVAAVLVAAVVLGLATAIDNPTRQAFVVELVGPSLVANAVSLNSILVNAARAVGPAVAGLTISGIGVGWCFLLNALSFAGVLYALSRIVVPYRAQPSSTRGERGKIREGFAYVAGKPALLLPFLMIFLVGMLTWEFPITLPLLARETFLGDASIYGYFTSAMGVGAVVGGLVVARLSRVGLIPIAVASAIFGVSTGALALAPTVTLAMVALPFVGAGATAFMSISNATMQLASAPEYRGRVMALWTVSFSGSTPVGGPIVGALGEHASPRWALGAGALACAVAVVMSLLTQRRISATDGAMPSDAEAEVDVIEPDEAVRPR